MELKRIMLSMATAMSVVLHVHGGELRTWCGPSGEQDWADPSNWVDGHVASADDTAYFPQNSAYHSNGTGQRRTFFKVVPPADFWGVILTTNEFAVKDWSAENLNMNFRPVLELEVLDGASWTVDGCGIVVATEGIGERLDSGFWGTVDVRKGVSFEAPANLNPKASIVGAGTLTLVSAAQVEQASAFAGTVRLPAATDVSVASIATLRNATMDIAGTRTLTIDASKAAFSHVSKLEGFVEAPGKWSFNGTAYEEGNIPSGSFNKSPPYVQDGELFLTDEPAQVHTVWYKARRFRLTDSWGMKFTYWPELPSDTRITNEPREDGKTRKQVICGYFGILLSRHSPDNCVAGVPYSGTGTRPANNKMANDARGLVLNLYRDDGGAKACWVSEEASSSYRSLNESCMNGVKLNQKMDFTVSMSEGIMTVTIEQDGKSITLVRDYSIIDSRAPEGYYIGFGGTSSWWGDDSNIPWVRSRISNFNAWYTDPTEGGGWEEIANSSEFNIADSQKWIYEKAKRGMDDAGNGVDVDTADGLFTSAGVKLLDSVPDNAGSILSKATVGQWNTPVAYRFTFKSENCVHVQDSDLYISFLFGERNSSTEGTGVIWNDRGSYYYANWMAWTRGLNANWNVNRGTLSVERSKWGKKPKSSNSEELVETPSNVSTITPSQSGNMGNTFVAATVNPAKNLRADFIFDGAESIKAICEVSLQDHTQSRPASSRGNGKIGVQIYEGLSEVDGPDVYAYFTNRALSVGVKAMERKNSYADMTMTGLSIRRMTSVQCGIMGRLKVSSGANATFVAGKAMSGQVADVVSVSSLELGAGASLRVKPESSATIAGVEDVSSAGATLVAEEGAKVSLGGKLAFASDPDETGLVLSGDVSFDGSLSISIPTSWKAYRCAPIVVVDASETVEGLPPDCTGIPIVDADGAVDSRKYVLSVRDGKLLLDFRKGLSVVVR